MSLLVPTLPPSVLGVTVYVQAATCAAAGCALTAPAAITLLDASF